MQPTPIPTPVTETFYSLALYHVKRQGLYFILLAAAVYYFYTSNQELKNDNASLRVKQDEMNMEMKDYLHNDRKELILVISRNNELYEKLLKER